MLLNFYVQADTQPPDQDVSYFESTISWLKSTSMHLSEVSWQDAKDWTILHTRETVDSAKDLFRYLSGDPVSAKSTAAQVALPEPRRQDPPADDRKGLWSGFTGLFGTLRGGSRKGPYEGTLDAGRGRVWQEGEVHADLVRVGVCRLSQWSHT
jgi:import inner membrane translocase subunit TIM21